MTSEDYRRLLNNDRKIMSLEDFDNTLMYFARLFHEEKINPKKKYERKKIYCDN